MTIQELTAESIVEELKPLGTEQYKKVLKNHGVPEPVIGVKIEELKKIQKRIKKNHELAIELYATGIYDAMYLAGLIADETRMTKRDLRRWVKQACCGVLCDYTVPWVAAETEHGHALAIEWIESANEDIAAAGWSTLSNFVSITDDSELDIPELKRLLSRVQKTIHDSSDRVRYSMNGFVIAVGAYVPSLTETALRVAERIGPVKVDMGKTACKVPAASASIRKVQKRGTVGKKRKTARC